MSTILPAPITRETLFVVSGGARGVTARCVIGLARRYGCRFILLGRSEAGAPPVWATDDMSEAALKQRIAAELAAEGEKPAPAAIRRRFTAITARREIAATLRDVAAAGGAAEYLSVDIADLTALRAALASAAPRLGPITGIIHGAGVLADKLIEQKQAADFDAVYTPKIAGLRNLLDCLPPGQLSHLVIFSSAAGFYGNSGQSDYALANEALNRAAYLIKRAHPRCRVVAFNWGPWDGGMVTPALKELFDRRGIAVIPPEAGVARLVDELAPRAEQPVLVLVGSPMPPPPTPLSGELRAFRVRRQLTLAANPFLQDHIIGGHPVLPATCGIAWLAHGCEQLVPGYRFFRCEDYQVLKGVVFDQTLAPAYTLTLTELARDEAAGELRFDALVSSEDGGRPRYHYRARIILRHTLPAPPPFTRFDLTERDPVAGAELYARGTLFHGPRFRGVERVLNSSPQRLTLRCLMPPIAERDQGQFPVQTINPYLADVQFQSLVIWAWQHYDAASLPLRTAAGEQYRPPPFGAPFYVTMEVRASDENRLVADLTSHDEQGGVYLRLSGAEVAISRQLNRLFVPATS